ncbi:MAG: Bax inhibitor-1 family protein [Rhodocyclaceae bacterium]|nr:Bax inhibitor-1 family protein [Rhodocyclaceae bacterium]
MSDVTTDRLVPAVAVARSNRVLRNTYALLALSLLPTVVGAWLGVAMHFSLFAESPLLAFMLFLGGAFAFMWGIEKNKHSGLGVVLLLAFTFFMGLMLSRLLQIALGLAQGGQIIALAFGGTSLIFFALAGIATHARRDFSNLGKFLFAGVLVLLLAGFANLFFQIPAVALAIAAVAVLLFSAYLIYDINRIVQGGEDNYITATLSIYLDLYNVFVGLVQLLMAFSGEKD